MKAVRVIVDVAGHRPELHLIPTTFDVTGTRADILLPDFPIDPSVIDRLEVVDTVSWVATSMHVEVSNDRRGVRIHLEKIAEVL
jgi:hypothetical protein